MYLRSTWLITVLSLHLCAFTSVGVRVKLTRTLSTVSSPNGVGTRRIFLELRSEVSSHSYLLQIDVSEIQAHQTLSPRMSPSLITAALSRYKPQTRLREKTKGNLMSFFYTE